MPIPESDRRPGPASGTGPTGATRPMKPAFSTVACPDWTLEQVADLAARSGYLGVELRTFGHGSAEFTPDPCLTGPGKVRYLFEQAGVDIAVLASSIRYDAPVFPPVLGRVFGDFEAPVKATRSLVRVAAQLQCPYLRVFPFELQERENRSQGLRRILERLDLACRTARHTGVRILLENGGSFPTAEDLAEIESRLRNPLLTFAYSPAVAAAAGEDPLDGIALLGGDLAVVKLKDFHAGRPVPIGDGDVPVAEIVRDLAASNFRGWCTVEWDRLWLPDLAPAEDVLIPSAERFYGWVKEGLARRPASSSAHLQPDRRPLTSRAANRPDVR